MSSVAKQVLILGVIVNAAIVMSLYVHAKLEEEHPVKEYTCKEEAALIYQTCTSSIMAVHYSFYAEHKDSVKRNCDRLVTDIACIQKGEE